MMRIPLWISLVRTSLGVWLCLANFMVLLTLLAAFVQWILLIRLVRAESCPSLWNAMDCIAHQSPLTMEFSRNSTEG